jgi:hypothetical protein
MTDWEITPFKGLGVLRFGMSRQEISILLNQTPQRFKKSFLAPNETDSYDTLGFHLYYDNNDLLEFIEAFNPCGVIFRGNRFLNLELSQAITIMENLGFTPILDSEGCDFKDVGFGLYAPLGTVEGVSIYQKGYYDE